MLLASFELLRALSRLEPAITTLSNGVPFEEFLQSRSWNIGQSESFDGSLPALGDEAETLFEPGEMLDPEELLQRQDDKQSEAAPETRNAEDTAAISDSSDEFAAANDDLVMSPVPSRDPLVSDSQGLRPLSEMSEVNIAPETSGALAGASAGSSVEPAPAIDPEPSTIATEQGRGKEVANTDAPAALGSFIHELSETSF